MNKEETKFVEDSDYPDFYRFMIEELGFTVK